MTFKDLLIQCAWSELWLCITEHYPDQMDLESVYKDIYDEMCVVDTIITKKKISVVQYPDNVDVSGTDGTLYKDTDYYVEKCKVDDVFANTEMSFGIEFDSWSEWASMEINPISMSGFTTYQIAAHCLWEMSYISFDEGEIKSTMDDMRAVMDSIKNGTIELSSLEIEEE